MATGYTTRQPLPYLIELGRDTLLTVPVYLEGALVEPSAGTVTVYDESNNKVVDAASVTVSGSVARYTVAGSSTSSRSPSAGWRVVWSLTLPGEAAAVVFREEAYLVRHRLYPVISDYDIGQRVPTLALSFPGRPTTDVTYHGAITEADIQLQGRLIEMGRRPWLVVSPSALRESWLTLAIAVIYGGIAASEGPEGPYSAKALEWEKKFESAFNRARMAMDWDDDGQADAGERVGPRPGGVWLC